MNFVSVPLTSRPTCLKQKVTARKKQHKIKQDPGLDCVGTPYNHLLHHQGRCGETQG